jgi:predicted acetylornithine/succinylornithine family transaminase
MNTYARQPVAFVRGQGVWLWDEAGKKYLDALAGIAVNTLGHNHPRLTRALTEQIGRIIHSSNLFQMPLQEQAADRIAAITGLDEVFFCNSGLEANEAAIKVARKAKPQGTIVSVHRGFHGRTYGSLSATPQESKQAPFAPLVPGFLAVEPTAAAVAAAVDEGTAAVILEPIQGESGVYVLPDDLLHAAREACDAHGAALIFDEVQCGLGRAGTLWAYQHSGVVPDAITVAKALGGGLPIGALITGERLADGFAAGDHGSTFAGGPVQCAAGLAVLDVIDDEDLLARVRELGARLREGVARLPGVGEIRGRGLMIAFELTEGGAPDVVLRALQEQRIVLNATSPTTVRLLPPLIIDEAQADDALARLLAVLA